MADEPEDPKRPKLVSFTERLKARSQEEADEFLYGLAGRLEARAQAAEAAGDLEQAIEMRAASYAVHAVDDLSWALFAVHKAEEVWEELQSLKAGD
jgi:hypothetical protein